MPPPPFPSPAGIADAWRLLRHGAPQVGAWALYLPVVGAGLGGLWLAADALGAALGGRFVGTLAVFGTALALTRARPLLALARVLAALPLERGERLAMLDAGAGPPVLAAGALVAGIELMLLGLLDRYRPVGLACAPLLGCCSMVVLAVGSRAARADGRRVKFAPAVTFREFGVASTATFAVVFLTTEFLGLLLIVATAAFTVGARLFVHRWIDGVNTTVLLATAEATQILILALLAAL